MANQVKMDKGFTLKQEDSWEFKVQDDIHFKHFYRIFYEYLGDNDYVSMWGDDRYETYYDEKHNPHGTREYRIRWRVYYQLPNDANTRLKFVMNWLVLDCKDKQVVVNGKKMKIQNVEIEIKCFSYVMLRKDAIGKNPLTRPFKDLFWNRWFRYQYEAYKDEIKARSKAIEEKLKALCAMKTYTDQGVQFHRVSGYRDPHTQNH